MPQLKKLKIKTLTH